MREQQSLPGVPASSISAWPHQIRPNKLLQEIRSFAEGAGLSRPIVDEVAAEIFMGDFWEKYLRAASRPTPVSGHCFPR